LPKEIKVSLFLLFFSAFVTAFGTHLDMDFYSDDGSYNPYIYAVDIFWLAVISWVAWDLVKKRSDIRATVLVVGLLIVGFNIWDYIDYGLSDGLYAYILESFIYIGMLFLLNTKSAKAWYVR
jgi:hypothetical protein